MLNNNLIKKNAPASEVYEEFRKEYMKYRDMLEKEGVDVSQFPKLMSYEEYKKADLTPGTNWNPFNWGKGQRPSIYK